MQTKRNKYELKETFILERIKKDFEELLEKIEANIKEEKKRAEMVSKEILKVSNEILKRKKNEQKTY